MAVDLYDLVDKVHDERTFLDFIAALAGDWEEEQRIEAKKPSSPYGDRR